MKIGVVYYSKQGTTKILAEAVQKGAASIAESVRLFHCAQEIDYEYLNECAAIVFGAPTYMGSVPADMKSFMDNTSSIWRNQLWKNKIAAGFTNSAALNGDKLNTLIQLAIFSFQHSMIWVGLDLSAGKDLNRLGSWIGMMAQSDGKKLLEEADVKTAEHLGRRVALTAKQFYSV